LCRKGRAAGCPEDWHDLRKVAKRLRYQLDGFRSLAPEPVDQALDTLRELQTALGDAQDRAAHAELLHQAGLAFARSTPLARSTEIDGGIARALLATGALVEWHRVRGELALAAAVKKFRKFDSRGSRRRFERLWDALQSAADPVVPGDSADVDDR
jgi:CHAD domain-containing protein